MDVSMVLEVGHGALEITLLLAGPLLLASLVAGLAVGVLQAMTQVNEITLTFIPKIIATGLTLVVFGPFMLHRLVAWTASLLTSLPTWVR